MVPCLVQNVIVAVVKPILPVIFHIDIIYGFRK